GLLYLLAEWAAGRLEGLASKAGWWLGLGALLAGVCDLVEDIGLGAMLSQGPHGELSPWVQAAWIMATVKFALILVVLAYTLLALASPPETHGFLAVAERVRFSLGLSLIAPLVLIFLDQGPDALRVLAERASDPGSSVGWFFLSAALYSLASWYW